MNGTNTEGDGWHWVQIVYLFACVPPRLLCVGLQVLVYHDLLGMMQHPHHAKVTPKFCKQYSAVGAVIQQVGAWLCMGLPGQA